MTPPTNLVAAAILLLLSLPIVLAVLVHIFEDSLPTLRLLLLQVFLMLAAAMLIGWLSLFLLLKAADYPKETSNVEARPRRACALSGLSDLLNPAFLAQRPTCLPEPY